MTSAAKQATFVGIIPARGGSKTLPRKNVLPLGGQPMMVYSIQAALDCRTISRCFVTSDDPEIKEIARAAGADVINRPAQLATDTATTAEVVTHALNAIEAIVPTVSHFVLLQPTSPLRSAEHVDAGLQLFLQSRADCLISVCEAEHHPYKSLRQEGAYLEPLFGEAYLGANRQSLPHVYHQNGAIYVMSVARFRQKNSFFASPAVGYVMKPAESIDVDTREDLALAEAELIRRRSSAGEKQ